MQSRAATVAEYLAALPPDRRAALETVRRVILKNLDTRGPDGKGGFAEGMQYGIIGYFVPHSVWPAGYHCDPKQPLPFGGLASQKNHMSLYLGCVYGSPRREAEFRRAWAATGKRLDMGKACIRFRRVEDLALDVIAEGVRSATVEKFLGEYRRLLGTVREAKATRAAAQAPAAKKPATRRAPPRRSPART